MRAPNPSTETGRLLSLESYEILDTPPEVSFDRITSLATRIFSVPMALVSLVDANRQWFKSCLGLSVPQTDREISFCAHAILSPGVMTIPDAAADQRFSDNPLVTGSPGIRFYAGAPLRTATGHLLGTLCVLDTMPREFSKAQEILLADLAAIVVDELDFRISKKKLQAELAEKKQLLLQNSLLSAAIHSATIGVLITDPNQSDNPIIFVNQGFEQITGYHAEESIGINCRFLQGVETDREQVRKMREAVADGRSFAGLLLNYRKGGVPFWNELAINPVIDSDGTLINFVGTQSDVTARIHAEQALKESEARLQAILDNTNSLIYIKDTAGRYLLANRRCRTLFSTAAEIQIVGNTDAALQPAEIASSLSENDKCVLDANAHMEFEEIIMQADGPHTYISLKFPLRDASGKPLAVCGISTDITARKQAAESLLQSQEKLMQAKAANAAKSEFLSRVSHELRTPLNAILGFNQLLQRYKLDIKQGECVEFIDKAGWHLLDLIDEMLDLTRIETGNKSIPSEAVEILGTLEESLSLVQNLAEKRSVRFKFDPAELKDHFVTANRQRLKQILVNLLSNAIKYNNEDGTVTITCKHRAPAHLCIRIHDTGRGIAPEKMERLFIQYERLGAEHEGIEGQGIGLALSQQLAALMGGQIEVESTAGRGSTFSIVLPIAINKEASPAKKRTMFDRHVEEIHIMRNVLCVEDNPTNLRLMGHIAREHPGVKLITAALGRHALPLALEHRPALILLDLHLSDMDGCDVLLQLRNEPLLSGTPIVIVSADATDQQAQRLLEAGADDYITKPVGVESILRLFSHYVYLTT